MLKTENKDLIEGTIREAYGSLLLNKEEALEVINFIEFIDSLNINTFFVKESVESIMTDIYKQSERQDIILDFLFTLNIKLSINGVDVEELVKTINKSISELVTTKELDNELIKQLKVDKETFSGSIINTCFLIKLYGINLLIEFTEILKGIKNV